MEDPEEKLHPKRSGAPRRVVIYGTRGFARELYQWLYDLNHEKHRVACQGFLVDQPHRKDTEVYGLPVLGDVRWLSDHTDVLAIIGVGRTAARFRIASQIEERQSFTLLHPKAILGNRVVLGAGSAVAPNAVATTEIIAGRHVQLHVGCTIGHDTVIGDFVTIAPGANVSGRVQIGDGVFIGAGAVVLPDVRIGSWSIVGAGAIVTSEVEDNVTVAGSPARVISRRQPGWHLSDDYTPRL